MPERPLRILHAVRDFPSRHRAGSELYVHDLCHAQIALSHHVTVLCATYDQKREHGEVSWRDDNGVPVAEVTNNWLCDTFEDTYREPLIGQHLESVLEAVKPDVLHVHDLLTLSFDLPRVARRLGIRVVATLHDYALVCPAGGHRVHRAASHVCHTIDTTRCARCFGESLYGGRAALGHLSGRAEPQGTLASLARTVRSFVPLTIARLTGRVPALPTLAADIDQRLVAARGVFDAVDVFVSPSGSVAREFIALGLPAAKVRVSDYGFRPRRYPPPPPSPHARLRLGFVGTAVWHKGAHVLLDAVRMLPANAVDLTIVGDLGLFPDYAADLRRRATGLRVTFVGGVSHADVERQYDRLDAVVVPSLSLENSPLVIHEAFMAGVPVVGSNLGGIADLVHHDGNGLLFEAGNAQALAHELRRLLVEPALLPRLAADRISIKSIDDDAREWAQLYGSLVDGSAAPSPP